MRERREIRGKRVILSYFLFFIFLLSFIIAVVPGKKIEYIFFYFPGNDTKTLSLRSAVDWPEVKEFNPDASL